MATGPGKYDQVCTVARHLTGARAVVLMIVEGDNGSGFSCQMQSPDDALQLVQVLRDVANQIEKDASGQAQ